MKKLLLLVTLMFVSASIFAATRITPVNKTMQIDKKGCNVTVYQTLLSAQKNGKIEEICIIEGTSSGSMHHTAERAIEKNAHEACGCGTDKVYVMSRSEPNGVTAHVALVAFKYVGTNQNVNSNTRSYVDQIKALATLRDDSIITEEEFQKQKAEILARE